MEWSSVVGGVLGAGGPLVWFLRYLDRKQAQRQAEQAARHAAQQQTSEVIVSSLERIENKVDHQAERLDEHIGWHAHRAHPSEVTVK